MTNWKKHMVFCRECSQWYDGLVHKNCPEGEAGSLMWLDLNSLQLGCNKCNQTWDIQDNVFYCRNGHAQETEYRDSVIVAQDGDHILAYSGDLVYMMTRTGTFVVGKRAFPYDACN
jgi:hypothetical protein